MLTSECYMSVAGTDSQLLWFPGEDQVSKFPSQMETPRTIYLGGAIDGWQLLMEEDFPFGGNMLAGRLLHHQCNTESLR